MPSATAEHVPSLQLDTPLTEAFRLSLLNAEKAGCPGALAEAKALLAEIEAAGGPSKHDEKLKAAAAAAAAKAKADADASAKKSA